MTSFIPIDDDYLSLAAIRSIRRDADQVEIEFNDGTKRSYSPKLDIFNHLDDLVGQIVPATGWRLAEYVADKVEYQTCRPTRMRRILSRRSLSGGRRKRRSEDIRNAFRSR